MLSVWYDEPQSVREGLQNLKLLSKCRRFSVLTGRHASEARELAIKVGLGLKATVHKYLCDRSIAAVQRLLGVFDTVFVIVQGIEAKESFVLNSKRRWVSWLTGNSRLLRCW